MKKKTKIRLCVLAGVVLLAAALCVLCLSHTSGFYSEGQHLARIQERAEKHFLGEGSEYTGLEVYPIYNEDDKLEYALIELQPQGFMYVKINENSFLEEFGGVSMYTMSEISPTPWEPYRIVNGKEEVFTDESGEPISYSESHFKVAGIVNERRYFLRTPTSEGPIVRPQYYLIPAVKRGEQYLDLTDGQMINYEPEVYSATFATLGFSFIGKSNFDL